MTDLGFEPPTARRPGLRRLAWGLLPVGLAGLAAAWFALAQPVAADEFGVRQIYLGPNKGVQKDEVYGPGLHLVIPGYERLHVFPHDIQTLDFNESERGFARERLGTDYHWAPSIRIQTSEGYQVTVDVTVLYRIEDPYTVLTRVGAGRLFETQVMERRADRILRQVLGALDAEDFYNDQVRIEKTRMAKEALEADVAEWGIVVVDVLLREYTYDERYQGAIEDRKIQDQRVFRNQAESVKATREAEKNRVLAEGEANVAVEAERGRAEVRKIAAEADLYFRQRIAEGDKLVALAEAQGTKLENQALQAVGAANLVGLEMAEALDGVEVIMVPTTGDEAMNPLDLDRLIRGF